MILYAIVDKKTRRITTETVDLDRITLYADRETAERRRRSSGMRYTHDIMAVGVLSMDKTQNK